MTEVLDQSEVDVLLAAVEQDGLDLSGGGEQGGGGGGPPTANEPYDFRQPEFLTPNQKEALKTLHLYFARDFKQALSSFLQDEVKVELREADVLAYSTMAGAFSNPFSCLNVLTAKPLSGQLIVEIHPAIVFPLIDKLLGGGKAVDVQAPERPLTTIEWRMVSSITQRIVAVLNTTWRKVADIDFRIVGTESNPVLVKIMAEHEPVVLIAFDLHMGEANGVMNVCIPFHALRPLLGRLTDLFGASPKTPAPGGDGRAKPHAPETPAVNADVQRSLLDAELDARCDIGFAMVKVNDLESLAAGDVVPIEAMAGAGAEFTFCVNGIPKFRVAPRSMRNHAAVQILRRMKKE
ncbi:MAG: FliM/FliN family flagellar motor switch protein [Planctomycetes bacterium]|nr:FliM/FliN family flagellar motor switch protein [Planctomycetota bacterium]